MKYIFLLALYMSFPLFGMEINSDNGLEQLKQQLKNDIKNCLPSEHQTDLKLKLAMQLCETAHKPHFDLSDMPNLKECENNVLISGPTSSQAIKAYKIVAANCLINGNYSLTDAQTIVNAIEQQARQEYAAQWKCTLL